MANWNRVLGALLVVVLFLGIAHNLRTIQSGAQGLAQQINQPDKVETASEVSPEPQTEQSSESLPASPQEATETPGNEAVTAAAERPDDPEHNAFTAPSKRIVIGSLQSEDTTWVQQELPDWQNALYLVDLPLNATLPPGYHRTPLNKGHEAMAYLTYMIDFYDDPADINVFLHAHRQGSVAWHTDGPNHDAVALLRKLNLTTVERDGYRNLRCTLSPGCPDEVQPFRLPVEERKETEVAFPYMYAELFGTPFSVMEEEIAVVATPCCAQFAVTGARIRARPKSDYEWYRSVLVRSALDDATSGRVLEYVWHIIFGRGPVDCPDFMACQCEMYGTCPRGRVW